MRENERADATSFVSEGEVGAFQDAAAQRRLVSRRVFIRQAIAASGAVAAAMYVKPDLTSIGVPAAWASVSPFALPPCITTVIDFEGLSKGTKVRYQYAAFGIEEIISKKYDGSNWSTYKWPMIFDSANPTGGDPDLGTPNTDFGGPGIGTGGKAGTPGENNTAKGKVLIISEDNHWWDPDDNAGGGRLVFIFDTPVRLDYVEVLDIDDNSLGSYVRTYDAKTGGTMTKSIQLQEYGNNSFQVVNVNQSGVLRLEVVLAGSGAVPALVFCR